jgi:protein-S-isoprenylcysteine O-methyltransferase Ste14
MGARAFVWSGGALFVLALSSCAWLYGFVLGRTTPLAGWTPLVVDAALLTLFALHHSLFARDRPKAWIAQHVPVPLQRSIYVWIASLLLLGVCLLWQSIGGEIYRATGLLALALAAVQLTGLWLTASGAARIDPLELAGIRQPPEQVGALQVTGPYGWVRHPLYLGWALMTFAAAHMTGDRLAFATMTTFYLVIAIPWEERSLRQTFGASYERYSRNVRWRMIPFIY